MKGREGGYAGVVVSEGENDVRARGIMTDAHFLFERGRGQRPDWLLTQSWALAVLECDGEDSA